jgi:RimJ/RimL family protein N-acetyltransferase
VRVRRAEAAVRLCERAAIDPTPLLGLRLRTEQLELRRGTEEEIAELARLADRGVHPPDQMPFRMPWTDRSGQELVDSTVEYHLRMREQWRPEKWTLALCVFLDDRPVGAQDVRGDEFASSREFETGSWLGREYQGQGYGTEMREAVLALGFVGLGAVAAISGAFDFNKASLRVSEKLGYEPAEETTFAPRGEPQRELVVRLTRAEWERRSHPPVEIEGLEPCLHLFGVR